MPGGKGETFLDEFINFGRYDQLIQLFQIVLFFFFKFNLFIYRQINYQCFTTMNYNTLIIKKLKIEG